jgi:hypothetical protein
MRFAVGKLPRATDRAVPVVNHLRLPLLASALLFLLFFPGIIRQGADTYLNATGKTQEPYLVRWLLLCACVFALSAIIYAARSRRVSRPHRTLIAEATRFVRRGERVLGVARDHDGECAAIATRSALYHRPSGDEAWQRTGWAAVDHVRWHADTGILAATGLLANGMPVAAVRLADPAGLPQIAHDLITATTITSTTIHLAGHHGAVITARRHPDTDDLVWAVRLDQGLEPDDPTVQAEIDAAIHTIRLDLAIPGPATHHPDAAPQV